MRSLAALAVAAASAGCHASPAPDAGPPTCLRVASHVEKLLPEDENHGEHRGKVRDVLAARCAADGWAGDVRACMLGEGDLHARHHCQDLLTAEQRTAFNRDLDAIDAPPPPAKLGASDVPAECEAYRDAVKALLTCDKLPSDQREAMRVAFETMSNSWSDLPPEGRQSLAVACQAGGDAIRQVLGACPP